MKFKLAKIFLAVILFSPFFSHTQRGKDNDYTVTVSNTILNTYTYLTANANAAATSLTVNSNLMNGANFSGNLAPGDLILIIQMQGATMDIDVTPTTVWGGSYTVPTAYLNDFNWYQSITKVAEWGKITNYNNSGKYEQVEVLSVAGSNTINLSCPLQNSYTSSGHVQVVRVPRYNNLTLNSSSTIVPTAWNGSTGGVVSIEVNGNLILNASSKITASGKGFRGGLTTSTLTTPATQVGFAGSCTPHGNGAGNVGSQIGSSNPGEGGRKGEGVGGYETEYSTIWYSNYAAGSPANGGGGGDYQNAGGGGGSNIGTGVYTGKGVPSSTYAAGYWNIELAGFAGSSSPGGGRGGYSLSGFDRDALTVSPNNAQWCGSPTTTDARKENGGFGGHPLLYDASRIFMGGGGGAGDQDNNQGGSGGTGGGIVLVTVYGTVTGSGTVESDGAVGVNSNPNGQSPSFGQKKGNDGAGGAGGAGAILLKNSTAIPATVSLLARGGAGGNQVISIGFGATMEASGPGGGGAGGSISYATGTPITSVIGGVGGTTNSTQLTEFIANGATNGASGLVNITSSIFNITTSNTTVCSGGTATLTAVVTGTLPSTLTWYSQQFGGSSIGTGTTYTTPALTTTTTYYVGVCPGTFRVPVVVTINPNPVISGVAVLTNPTCSSAGSITGLTASSGTPNYTYSWNGTVTPSANYLNIPAGNYTLTVTDINNCTATSGPYALVGTSGPIIDVTNLVVQNQNCNGTLGSISGITATGTATLTYSWTNGAGNTLNASNLTAGNYTLTVTDGNSCVSSTTPINVGMITGPVISTAGIIITPSTCGNANGSISGITSTGTGLSYTWNAIASPTINISNQLSGNYTLVVMDGNGCTASSGPHMITNVAGPTISAAAIVITPESCNQANGSISGLSINGGTPTFTIAWTNTAQTSLNINSLTAGNYSITVTDQNGCVANSGPYVITSSGGPVLNETNVVVTHVLCNGTLGSISGITSSGTGLIYSWSNGGGNSLNASNLVAGSYVLTVTDGNGCIATSSSQTVLPPVPIVIDTNNITINQTSCTANTGSISGIVISGGVNPVVSWSNSASTLDISNLGVGMYTLSVTDNTGCASSITIPISTLNGPVIDTSNMLIVDGTCGLNNGSISGVQVNGGTSPYIYMWNSNASLNTLDLNPAISGMNTLSVTDFQGCSAIMNINVNSSPAISINSSSVSVIQPTCISLGSISGLTANGAVPITYSWTNSAQTTIDLSNLAPGSYSLTAVDNNSCISTYGPVILAAPTNPTASFNWNPLSPDVNENVVFTNTSIGSNIISSTWTILGQQYVSEDTQYAFNEEGTYTILLEIIDAGGCVDSISQTISVFGVTITPNIITANGDGVNDFFEIKYLKPNTSLTIMNRWGNVVFNTDDYKNDWDGTDISGKKLVEGVYTYVETKPDGNIEHGFVHLVR